MLDLTCWACGWDGRVAESYAGLRVRCKRCGAVNAVPEPVTQELFVAGWLEAIDAGWTGTTAESPTAEFECFPAAV